MEFEERLYLISRGGSAVAAAGPESLYDIQCYYEAMEAFLASTEGERRLRLQAMRGRIDPEISEFLANTENAMLWDEYFPSELRASILVSTMSFLDRYLNGVCKEAQILLRKPIGHNKLKGSGIERAKTFLNELCGFKNPSDSSWESVRTLQRLRNNFVHGPSAFESPEDLKKIQNLTKHLPGVSAHELGIDLEPEFIQYALSEIGTFLDEMKSAFAEVCEDVVRFEPEA